MISIIRTWCDGQSYIDIDKCYLVSKFRVNEITGNVLSLSG